MSSLIRGLQDDISDDGVVTDAMNYLTSGQDHYMSDVVNDPQRQQQVNEYLENPYRANALYNYPIDVNQGQVVFNGQLQPYTVPQQQWYNPNQPQIYMNAPLQTAANAPYVQQMQSYQHIQPVDHIQGHQPMYNPVVQGIVPQQYSTIPAQQDPNQVMLQNTTVMPQNVPPNTMPHNPALPTAPQVLDRPAAEPQAHPDPAINTTLQSGASTDAIDSQQPQQQQNQQQQPSELGVPPALHSTNTLNAAATTKPPDRAPIGSSDNGTATRGIPTDGGTAERQSNPDQRGAMYYGHSVITGFTPAGGQQFKQQPPASDTRMWKGPSTGAGESAAGNGGNVFSVTPGVAGLASAAGSKTATQTTPIVLNTSARQGSGDTGNSCVAESSAAEGAPLVSTGLTPAVASGPAPVKLVQVGGKRGGRVSVGANKPLDKQERNRQSQKRFRDNQKTRKADLENVYKELKEKVEKMKLDNNALSQRNTILEKVLSMRDDTMKKPDELAHETFDSTDVRTDQARGGGVKQRVNISVQWRDYTSISARDVFSMTSEQICSLYSCYVKQLAQVLIKLSDSSGEENDQHQERLEVLVKELLDISRLSSKFTQVLQEMPEGHELNARHIHDRWKDMVRVAAPTPEQKQAVYHKRQQFYEELQKCLMARKRVHSRLQDLHGADGEQARSGANCSKLFLSTNDVVSELRQSLQTEQRLCTEFSHYFWSKIMTPVQYAKVAVRAFPEDASDAQLAPDSQAISHIIAQQAAAEQDLGTASAQNASSSHSSNEQVNLIRLCQQRLDQESQQI